MLGIVPEKRFDNNNRFFIFLKFPKLSDKVPENLLCPKLSVVNETAFENNVSGSEPLKKLFWTSKYCKC